jgi:hypothetical protein
MIVDLPMAPLAVLAFLACALFIVGMIAIVIFARLQKNSTLAVKGLKILAGGTGVYVVVLLAVSAFSKDYNLGFGAEKHFCELDCHIAYSVTKVETPTIVPADFASATRPPTGNLYVVTLRTRFDQNTIGANRGDGQLVPNPRKIVVRDEAGKEYAPTCEFAGTSMDQPLRPGESYETRILFTLPTEAKSPRLFLRNDPWPNSLIIGHENSPLHGKAYFALKG